MMHYNTITIKLRGENGPDMAEIHLPPIRGENGPDMAEIHLPPSLEVRMDPIWLRFTSLPP